MARLTDKTTTTGVTLNYLFHVVNPTDLSQNAAGSSYKAEVQQLLDLITGITEPSYTELSISSSDILNMGSSPIVLLPVPGVNNYYDIDRIVLEYSGGSSTYNFGVNNFPTVFFSGFNKYQIITNGGWDTNDRIWIVIFAASELANDGSQDYPKVTSQDKNESIIFTTWTGANPTTGDGTILAKIWYKVRTFG